MAGMWHQCIQTPLNLITVQNHFFLRINKRNVRVDFSEIHFIVASKNYTQIVMPAKSLKALISLRQMEELLPASKFCRIHRSYIISMDHLTAFDNIGAYIGDQMIPIGEHYRNVLPSRVKVVLSDVRYAHHANGIENFNIMETPN
jgi:DNA-binding LytR/AlgR family response regulator